MRYADASFLVAAYTAETQTIEALKWLQRASEPLPFTPFHRHEVRSAIRMKVFRGEMTAEDRSTAFREIDLDLEDSTLIHTPVPWTEAFREAEQIGASAETIGARSFDLLHIGIALALGAERFLTFDQRQATCAEKAGLRLEF